MARITTLLSAVALTAATASPALACSWGKTAKMDQQTMAEVKAPEATEEAMTTFDPAEKPVFEKSVENDEDAVKEVVTSD